MSQLDEGGGFVSRADAGYTTSCLLHLQFPRDLPGPDLAFLKPELGFQGLLWTPVDAHIDGRFVECERVCEDLVFLSGNMSASSEPEGSPWHMTQTMFETCNGPAMFVALQPVLFLSSSRTRLVVRTSRGGRDRPGLSPGLVKFVCEERGVLFVLQIVVLRLGRPFVDGESQWM